MEFGKDSRGCRTAESGRLPQVSQRACWFLCFQKCCMDTGITTTARRCFSSLARCLGAAPGRSSRRCSHLGWHGRSASRSLNTRRTLSDTCFASDSLLSDANQGKRYWQGRTRGKEAQRIALRHFDPHVLRCEPYCAQTSSNAMAHCN